MINQFLTRNDAKYRLARTIVQGLIGFLLDNIAMIVAQTQFSAIVQALIVSGTMAVLSPIMKAMGTDEMPEKEELDPNYFEGGEDDGNC